MGKETGGGNNAPPPISANGQAYLTANPDVANEPLYANDPWGHFVDYGRGEGRAWEQPVVEEPSGGSDPFDWMSALAHLDAVGRDAREKSAEAYQLQIAGQRQAQEKAQQEYGRGQTNDAYSNYVNASSSATDFINAQIEGERANAALLGTDYDVTDEQKTERISNYFATIWGEGDQARLEGLIGQYGNPSGFQGFQTKRGDGSKYVGTSTTETSEGTSTGLRPGKKKKSTLATLAEEDTPILGSSFATLGAT